MENTKNLLKIKNNQKKSLLNSQKVPINRAHLNLAKLAVKKTKPKTMIQIKAKKDNYLTLKKVLNRAKLV